MRQWVSDVIGVWALTPGSTGMLPVPETDRKTKLGVGEGCPATLEMGRALETLGENLPGLLSVNWKEHTEMAMNLWRNSSWSLGSFIYSFICSVNAVWTPILCHTIYYGPKEWAWHSFCPRESNSQWVGSHVEAGSYETPEQRGRRYCAHVLSLILALRYYFLFLLYNSLNRIAGVNSV